MLTARLQWHAPLLSRFLSSETQLVVPALSRETQILKNEQTLNDNGVTEAGFVVVMVMTAAAPAEPAAAPAAEAAPAGAAAPEDAAAGSGLVTGAALEEKIMMVGRRGATICRAKQRWRGGRRVCGGVWGWLRRSPLLGSFSDCTAPYHARGFPVCLFVCVCFRSWRWALSGSR